ncbi:trans-resveratrol di-O-methyltransferase-like [Senna tora]|uniref:isoflavone 7-O-methyltransferase n=1 Tax=Senna tora TaxID=362788 RepID=A0A834SM13_9FABA|nr:trans-resveratrol di-O-methyltransferase-like [Senna tora]
MGSEGGNDMFKGQAELYRVLMNFVSSMGLKASIELGIADIIENHGQPITLSELVSALQIDHERSSFLYRLMRLLAHDGIFEKTKVKEEEAYGLTPCSRLLLKDHVPSLVSSIKFMFDPALTQPYHVLGEWLLRKDDVKVTHFEAVFGKGFWEYGSENPEFAKLFNESMGSDSEMMNLVLKDCKHVFEGVNLLVDGGGGVGKTARIISNQFPNIKCTVVDLPHVVSGLQDSENVKFLGGDMRQHIPSADVILFKNVLHTFSDEDCVEILKKARKAISGEGKEGKVILIDVVINEKKDTYELTKTKIYFDLLMMVLTPGRDREEKEWDKIFKEAGFSRYDIAHFGVRSLLQVYP